MSDLPIIKDSRKVDVPTVRGEMVLEANWAPEVTPCINLRVKIGGITVEVETEKLIATLMFFANSSQMNKLMAKAPMAVREFETMIEIVTHKDIPAGGKIMLPVSIRVPEDGSQPTLSTLTTSY